MPVGMIGYFDDAAGSSHSTALVLQATEHERARKKREEVYIGLV